MVHGDDQGLVLPPRLAPVQAVIVPIYRNDAEKSKVMEVADRVFRELKDHGIRVNQECSGCGISLMLSGQLTSRGRVRSFVAIAPAATPVSPASR